MRGQSVSAGLRARMARSKRGLQRIGPIAPESFGAGQRVKASADQQLVPACAILPGQGQEGAVRPDACRQARCLDFHQGQKAEHFGIIGHQPRQVGSVLPNRFKQKVVLAIKNTGYEQIAQPTQLSLG